MSDGSAGQGWWLASDGQWYPPEQAPGWAPPPEPAPPIDPSTGPPPPALAAPVYADFVTRAIALAIDAVVWVVVWGVLLGASLAARTASAALGGVLLALAWVVFLALYLYSGYLVGTKGASPGMAMMGLRCLDERTSQPVGGGPGALRALTTGVASLIWWAGYLAYFTRPDRKTVGDVVVHSVVIGDQPKQPLGLDLYRP